MLNANELLQKGIKQVENAGIKPGKINPNVVINTTASSFYGLCTKRKNGIYDYTIELNKNLLLGEEIYTMNTLVHEILHSVEGCMNHGPKWKRVVGIVNKKYGYNIKRCSTSEEKGMQDIESKYVIQCEKCNSKYHRDRVSNLVKYPERYSCGSCKGKLKLVKGDLKTPAPTQPKTKLNTKGFKYTITCQSCKATFGRKVMSKAIKNIKNYRCSCGGRSLEVKQNY